MAAELAGGLGAVGLFALPGFGLTELFPRLRRLPLARRAAYGYLLGILAVSGSLYALSHVGGVPLRQPAIWTVAGLPIAAGLAVRLARRRGARDRGLDRIAFGATGAAPGHRHAGAANLLHQAASWLRGLGGPFGAICLLLAAVVCTAVFAEAVSDPVNDWDGRMTWGTQARYVRQAGTVDAEALRNPRWYVTHPQYPLLLPVAQVAVLEAFGADPDAPLVRAIYAAFLPALLLVIYDGARRGAGPRAAALAVLTLAVTPYMLLGTGGAATTYSDLALACFYGAALGLLLAPRPCTADGVAAGLLLAGAALVKNEGAVLAALVLALGWRPGRPAESTAAGRRPAENTAAGRRPAESTGAGCRPVEISAAGRRPAGVPPRMRRLLAAALPLMLALALLASWRAGIPNRQDDAYPELLQVGARPLAAVVSGIGARLAACAPIVWQDMTSREHWAGFWWMVAAALVAGHRALRHPLHRRRLAAAAGPPAIAWAAYAVHPLGPVLAAVTWERFLLQGAVPLMIVVAGAFAAMGRRWRAGGMPGRRR